jgi:DNA-directed RNA polymerase subunit RPC12/RpoP
MKYAKVNCTDCGKEVSEIVTIDGRCLDCDLQYKIEQNNIL